MEPFRRFTGGISTGIALVRGGRHALQVANSMFPPAQRIRSMPARRRFRARPRRVYRNKRRSRRRVQRRRRAAQQRRRGFRPMQAIGFKEVPVSFTMCDSFDIPEVAASVSQFTNFTPGNINDPLDSDSAQQPRGYDQWVAFYSEFRCLSVNVDVLMWKNLRGTTDYVVWMVPYRNTDGAPVVAAASWISACEYPRMQMKTILHELESGGTQTIGPTKRLRFNYHASQPKYFAESAKDGNFDAVIATAGPTNPTKFIGVQLGYTQYNNQNPGTTNTVFAGMVKVTINGVLRKRKQIAQSTA